MKCKCILESNSMVNDLSLGGPFSFTPGEVYEFYVEDEAYIVVKDRLEIGFDEKQFNKTFEIVEYENIGI